MVGHNVAQELEPEERNLGQHAPLMRDAGGQHIVEGRDAVGGHEEQTIRVEVVHIADFSAGMQFEFGKSVRSRTESRSWGLMLEFYRQKTWRILACQKYLSTP